MTMSAAEVGKGLVAHCQRGDFAGAMAAYYHADIESVEGDGSMVPAGRVHGLDACIEKGKYWQAANEVHSMSVSGPFLGDGQFAVIYDIDVTERASGNRFTGKEVGIYRVVDGKIVYENFMGMPMG
jgi:hypothetical protein